MLPWLIVAGVVGAVLIPSLRRLTNLHDIPVLIWPVSLASAAMPFAVLYVLMNPGASVSSGKVAQLHGKLSLDVPENHSILVTATLGEETDDPATGKTAYTLKLNGENWTQTESATISRKDSGGGPDVDVVDGEGIVDSTRRRSAGLGEDLEERWDLRGTGKVDLEVTNWEGEAARYLDVHIIPSPPPEWMLWLVAGLISVGGIVLETRNNVDRISGDVAFLALWGVFMRSRVTPLDSLGEVLGSALPAALIGWGAVGGISYLILRFSMPKAAPDEPDAAKPERPEPPPDTAAGRRLKKRR